MAQGIILAGGNSSRMKINKLLLDINGEPLVFHTVKSLLPFVNKIIVVSGTYHNELKGALKIFDNVEIIFNENHQQGMFSSLQKGLTLIDDDFFVLPGDCPFVFSSTMKALLCGNGLIRVPSYHGENGHPIFFDKSLIKPLLSEDALSTNLKAFRDKCGYQSILVNDKNILNDIDTPLDYQTFLKQ